MTFLCIKWIHAHSDEPVLLFSELNAQRFETRKVEVFLDGRQVYASETEEYGGSRLGELPVPEFSEIAADPEFEPVSISASDFEKVWAGRTGTYAVYG